MTKDEKQSEEDTDSGESSEEEEEREEDMLADASTSQPPGSGKAPSTQSALPGKEDSVLIYCTCREW